jgi:hypothetical protein
VTPKTVPITNPNVVHEAHHNHLWEFRLDIVESKIVPTNGYKQSQTSRDLAHGLQRYTHFKSITPL